MTKNHVVRICLTLPLRDFAAFEDLANELGCKLEVEGLSVPEQKAANGAAPKRRKPKDEDIKYIQSQFTENPRSARVLKEDLNLPFGVSTISKIIKEVRQ